MSLVEIQSSLRIPYIPSVGPKLMAPPIRDTSHSSSHEVLVSDSRAMEKTLNGHGETNGYSDMHHCDPEIIDSASPLEKPLESLNGVSADMTILGNVALPPASSEPVTAPFGYINSLPSKGVRGTLIDALNVWIEASPESLIGIRSVINDVHNLSLMLDDVQDNSPLRRGKPSTHCVFGMSQTVNSATYQIVDVLSRTWERGDTELLKIVMDEMKQLLIGQGHDLVWTNLVSAPSVEEYLQMIDGKTGGLFRMISRLLIAQSQYVTKPANLDRLMTLFGRFFQIRDDYINLVSVQYMQTKGFCEDLDEGKYSFTLIHALNGEPRLRSLLQNMLMQRRVAGKAPIEHKELILTLLHETGSLEYTAKALVSLSCDLEKEIGYIETHTGKPNPSLREIIKALLL